MPAQSRKLLYLPIIHTALDMGSLAANVRSRTVAAQGRAALRQKADVVHRMWERIESFAAGLPIAAGSTPVYQDGLPVCGHEREIVSELAAAGNCNHKLLLALEARGATLMGTESPELLVEEYQLATSAFAAGTAARGDRRQQQLRALLLEKRDAAIAARIASTLRPAETGILFIGLLHRVERHLPADIQVTFPLGRPEVSHR
jgi:hypothetical protein